MAELPHATVSLSSPGAAICDSDLSVLSGGHPRWETYSDQEPGNWGGDHSDRHRSRVEVGIDDSKVTNSKPSEAGEPTCNRNRQDLTMHVPTRRGGMTGCSRIAVSSSYDSTSLLKLSKSPSSPPSVWQHRVVEIGKHRIVLFTDSHLCFRASY